MEHENVAQNQTVVTENNQSAISISVQQNTVPETGQLMSVPNSHSLPQQVVDPNGQAHALMVPVTFENCHQAIRVRMAPGLNLPPRFVSEVEPQTSGFNVPCLVGHPLALRPPLVSECSYTLPLPHLVSDSNMQPTENIGAVPQSVAPPLQPPTMSENIPQPLFTHNGQPIAVRLPLRRPNSDEGSPEIDSRIPPRFVRLEGTNFSGLRGSFYRPRREGNKDFKSGSPDS